LEPLPDFKQCSGYREFTAKGKAAALTDKNKNKKGNFCYGLFANDMQDLKTSGVICRYSQGGGRDRAVTHQHKIGH